MSKEVCYTSCLWVGVSGLKEQRITQIAILINFLGDKTNSG